jgi:hypothetical protein
MSMRCSTWAKPGRMSRQRVALVMWIPRYRLGVVCCYGLGASSGLYGEDAVRLLDERLQRTACEWADVSLSLAGGAQQHGGCAGERNVRWAQAWSDSLGIEPVQQDLGGRALRKMNFNLADGTLSLSHGGCLAGDT